ncbi:MAG: glucokinase [Candidatus Promineifilaceae bacterium]|jgi:glucokinase
MLLAGDIGGTKTVLAVFEEDTTDFDHKPLYEEVFPSTKFDSLEAIILDFLQDKPLEVSGACFGVAGPVVGLRAEITNLDWLIDARSIAKILGVHTYLLNDLEAIANAVPHLDAKDLFVLNEGEPNQEGAIGVIAPGTGLGEAFLVWDGQRYESYPSEGGHAAFAPTNSRQIDLLTYWLQRMDHVSYERLCSGIGIPNIYRFLLDSGDYEEPAWLRESLNEAKDSTPVIVRAAIEGSAEICLETLNLFMEILGGEAANLALKVLATGGIYIGGGIPPRILPQLESSRFMEVFRSKGRFSEMMATMPVYVIRNPKVALYGAAYEALRAPERR